ncbi:hypothetical protein K2173_024888 [Erythroxylum novogranatense]|uniref:Fe2OG dioxygenase domain-containing protein n=1 Tax=Erythroxylum novogranatense TaxID=1862640 RepID=A0AAV8UGS2_9ROSI|nr:hypothetical protein K2173_024888 [Erythroxylum novogranatense]
MEAEKVLESSYGFTSAMTLTELGNPQVPQRYVLPLSERPNPTLHPSISLPIVDLSSLKHPSSSSPRSETINEIQRACKEFGFFQVINHGILQCTMRDAMEAATDFFDLPVEEKMILMSENVHEPVRYGTSLNHATDKKMSKYATEVENLQKQLMELVLESLGLNSNYLVDDIDNGSQVMTVNCYPACPEPELTLGIPAHSDYGTLTILHQSCSGLQLLDSNENWVPVPLVEGALIVLLGDQLEVMSNGHYKSVLHRVIVSSDTKRLSIASLHSLALNKKMAPAPELLNEQNPAGYKEFSFRDFLDFISSRDALQGRFIDTLKKDR